MALFLAIVTIMGFIAVAGVLSLRARGIASVPAARVTSITQVTHDGFRKTRLLADDSQLFVTEVPASQRVIAKVSLPESNRSLVASPFSNLQALDLSPDRTKLLVAPIQSGSREDEFWTLPVGTGSPQRIGTLAGRDAVWSPDGQQLVFSKGSILYLSSATGTGVRELYTATGSVFGPHFSPDGKRHSASPSSDTEHNTTAIWEVSRDVVPTRPTLCWRRGSMPRPPVVAAGPPTAATIFSRHCKTSPTPAPRLPRSGHCPSPLRPPTALQNSCA